LPVSSTSAPPEKISSEDHWRLVESILAARRSEPRGDPDLRPLEATALSSRLPPLAIPRYRALPESVLDDHLGDCQLAPGVTNLGGYRLTPGGTIRIFLFDEKPYIHLPGVGDIQMFPTARDTFTSRVLLGLRMAFERDANHEAKEMALTLGDSTLRASRAARPWQPLRVRPPSGPRWG
jgi:hypothetical protein